MTATLRLQPTVLAPAFAFLAGWRASATEPGPPLRPRARAAVSGPAESTELDGATATGREHPFDLVFERGTELFLADPRDPVHAVRPLAPFGVKGREPAGSPDGYRIAYAAPDIHGRTDIWVFDRRAAGLSIQLTAGPASDDHPGWSPDGSRVVFRRRAGGGPGQIWVMNADGSNQANISAGQAGMMSAPAWSPAAGGGERIAYVASVNGNGELWTMRPDGSDRLRITTGTETVDDEPAWSPDGSTLAFTRTGSRGRHVWLVNADGGNERPLLNLPMHQFAPAWSPDGRQLAFTSTHTGRAEIFTAPVSAAVRPTQRTFDGATNSNPVWVVRR